MSYSPRDSMSTSVRAFSEEPRFFADVGALLGRIGACRNEMELVAILRQTARRLGADSAFFVSFVREDALFESYEFLLACDPLWALEYEQLGCFAEDPWLAYSRSHTEPVRGKEIVSSTRGASSALGLAERYGFRSTVVIPAPAGSGSSRLGMLVLGSKAIDFLEGDDYVPVKVLSRSLAMELNGRLGELLGREILLSGHLTATDLLLLAYAREGLPTKSIVREVGLSAEAIDTRFRRMNTNLRTPNRKAAAKLASDFGLI